MFYEFRVNSQFVSRQRWGSWRPHVLGAKTRFRGALCLQGWRYHAPSSHQEQTVTAIRRNKASNHVRLGFWAFPWLVFGRCTLKRFGLPDGQTLKPHCRLETRFEACDTADAEACATFCKLHRSRFTFSCPVLDNAAQIQKLLTPMPDVPEQFVGVTAVAKANIYFNGSVVSHALLFPDGSKKTLGLIFPGKYHFNTDSAERMQIVAGNCEVLLDGQG